MTAISDTISEMQDKVKNSKHIHPHGGGSKPSLSIHPDNFSSMDMKSLSGVIEYNPEEFTISALAGTPVAGLKTILAENNQYLPFDPPFVERGATLGGTVAAGVNGPGRYRFGGLRDFLLGVKYIDYSGTIQRGGGKVVKNAAGFDLAKVMIGSLGSFGVIIETTFKVFPAPERYNTIRLNFETLENALDTLQKASLSYLDFDSIELISENEGWKLNIRIGGTEETAEARVQRVREFFGDGEILQDGHDKTIWRDFREFSWVPEGWMLIKIPIVPGKIAEFESKIINSGSLRQYSCAGQVLWLAVEDAIEDVDKTLIDMDLSGLIISGSSNRKRAGVDISGSFYRKVKSALDPVNRFVEV